VILQFTQFEVWVNGDHILLIKNRQPDVNWRFLFSNLGEGFHDVCDGSPDEFAQDFPKLVLRGLNPQDKHGTVKFPFNEFRQNGQRQAVAGGAHAIDGIQFYPQNRTGRLAQVGGIEEDNQIGLEGPQRGRDVLGRRSAFEREERIRRGSSRQDLTDHHQPSGVVSA
jgi:hypothetical protein